MVHGLLIAEAAFAEEPSLSGTQAAAAASVSGGAALGSRAQAR